ncbi:hypothetical protein NHX12_024260 [Muraenolepis orangiensis]|uniref:A-kinase anchor protein 9 n=1 Tax=Muraenolepis orangiensis TaxID=630683 RepID=A0A9Q0EMC7_9TELE|nr:hypothetical protein NHX12_024260 [Muraenolepis orangiensis]
MAEYRQRKRPAPGEELPAGGRVRGIPDRSTTELTFSRTLRSGETVKHDQTYTIEPESELSTTADDYSSEVNGCHVMTVNLTTSSEELIWEEVEALQQMAKEAKMEDMEDELAAKTQELEEIRASFGTEGIHQLQDFEAALKQRDGIITQLTSNLQQARDEKEDIMREFLEMTEQSRKLHIQFQQLQAGETLRNTTHSSTASDLLQARQQVVQYQQQLDELGAQVRSGEEHALLTVSRLETAGQRAEETFAKKLSEKDSVIAEQEHWISDHEQSLADLRSQLTLSTRASEESLTHALRENDLLISEQNAIISAHERSLSLLRDELAQVVSGASRAEVQSVNEKDSVIREQAAVISERQRSLAELEERLKSSEKGLEELCSAKGRELEECQKQLQSTRADLEHHKVEWEDLKLALDNRMRELESCKDELLNSKAEMKVELERCQGELEHSKSDLKKRQIEFKSCRDELENSKLELESHMKESEDSKSELERYKKEFEDSKLELESYKKASEHSKLELERYKKEFEDSKLELENEGMAARSFKDELESSKVELEKAARSFKDELESSKVELEKGARELESCKEELAASIQKERTSSSEVMELMGTVEDLQKRCHKGSVSEGDAVQRAEEESLRKLECLRAELDEMYGQQIVQMKRELNLQHTEATERLAQQHGADLAALGVREEESCAAADQLNHKLEELRETLGESQAAHGRATDELGALVQEKSGLQARVEELLRDLHLAQDAAEAVSHHLTVRKGSLQTELQHLQRTADGLRCRLEAAEDAALETEAKHESEVTNYKIKLEMLEREKDAVLDRMAESQEAELERLRTQLLFSHEEELVLLREDLQRESFLNAANLLDEASSKRERALEELRAVYEDKLASLGKEKAAFAMERDKLLEQILALKEESTASVAVSGSKAEELVQQLQELRVEVVELRKGAEERAKIERDHETLLTKIKTLENEAREKDNGWKGRLEELFESEKRTLMESTGVLKQEVDSANAAVRSLTLECNQKVQEVAELREEIEKQSTTFSFAEKNFEVNYQELKGEYTCLVQAKTQLEERMLKETLAFEAKIAGLQSLVRELEEEAESCRLVKVEADSRGDRAAAALTEKDATDLMEKLGSISNEKESLIARLSNVTDKLSLSEGKLERLKGELLEIHQEHGKVIARNTSLTAELEREAAAAELKREGEQRRRSKPQQRLHETSSARCSVADHPRQIHALQGEVEALRSRLQAAEAERASPAAARSTGAGPEPAMKPGEPAGAEHGECKLQLEAQRLSLSQIHAAQLELLGEQTAHHTTPLETRLDGRSERRGHDMADRQPAPMSRSEEVETVRSEARGQCLLLEDSHRQELEHLRSHYQQLASDAQERDSAGETPAVGQTSLEEKRYWERVEEEVAKVIVQMSVEFAQQSELARIGKRDRQTTSSMQTHPEEEGVEGRENLETEVRELTSEVVGLKERLREAASQAAHEVGTSLYRLKESPAVWIWNVLREHNFRLHQVLQDVLQTTAAAEETMGLHVASLRSLPPASTEPPPPAAATAAGDLRSRASWERLSTKPFHVYTAGKSFQGYMVEERSYAYEWFLL